MAFQPWVRQVSALHCQGAGKFLGPGSQRTEPSEGLLVGSLERFASTMFLFSLDTLACSLVWVRSYKVF